MDLGTKRRRPQRSSTGRQVANRVRPEEVDELLLLRDWSYARLAAEMDVTEPTVRAWMSRANPITGPAGVLIRLWLSEAKAR